MIAYSVEDIKRVELSTRGQSKSIRWYDEHHCRISASNFGTFCKALITTNKVKSLLYSGFKSPFTSSAILLGKTHETSAFHQYQASLSTESILRESGIYISHHGFLTASFDGIVVSAETSKCCRVIEIKCPYTMRNLSVTEACKQKGFCELDDNNEIHLKQTHQYYYQAQGSMAIFGLHE